MPTNPYFNHYYAQNEQNLIDGMVIESIQTQGLDIAYIPRTQDNIDHLYKEDPTNTFTRTGLYIDPDYKDPSYINSTVLVRIEMYPAFVDGFDGEGEMFSRFGLDIKKTATFIVSRTRFKEEFPEFERPREGDLLVMPITNAVLEIKNVNLESPFFEKGKQYVYEIKAETFEYGYEDIQTNDLELDEFLSDNMLIDDLLDPSKAGGVNEDIQTDGEANIIFDPANPFGVR